MGSSFEDLDVNNPSLKTDRDLKTRFANYFIFCLRTKRRKRKRTHPIYTQLQRTSDTPLAYTWRAENSRGSKCTPKMRHVLLADATPGALPGRARFF